MKKNKILTLIIIPILMLCLLVGCSSDKNGGSLLIEDTEPTSSVVGNEGDLYLDTSTYEMYKYEDGEWIKAGSITEVDNDVASVLINKDGYWVINGKVTGVKATGKDGVDGKDGKNGVNGKDGKNGVDGKDGKDGIDGKDGKDGVDGKDGKDGVDGKDGQAATITINEDGYWVINGIVTDVRAGTRSICKSVTEATKTKNIGTVASSRDDYSSVKFKPGDEYICEVKKGTEYHFFVLSVEGNNVNLIMDQNLYYDEENDVTTVATVDTKGLVQWYTEADTSYGPVTAMDYLYKATKDWENIPDIAITYDDEGKSGSTGYGSIITTNNLTKITKKDGTIVTVLSGEKGYKNLKARLPRMDEIQKEGCTSATGSCNALWLINNLTNSTGLEGKPLQNIQGINGYWILSSVKARTDFAYRIYRNGNIGASEVNETNRAGVRPVITLSKNDISTNIINN